MFFVNVYEYTWMTACTVSQLLKICHLSTEKTSFNPSVFTVVLTDVDLLSVKLSAYCSFFTFIAYKQKREAGQVLSCIHGFFTIIRNK